MLRAALTALVTVTVAAGALAGSVPGVAHADSAPLDAGNPRTPPTVTADPLPTVQINGVVWSQVVVGNTVYAGGEFTSARPAGAPPGVGEVTRNNLLAYDVRTGELVTSFVPDLNAQVKVVAASPDGSRIYVGGSFTTANGQPRYRIAAYDTATGALDTAFRPQLNMQVKGLAVSNDTVYVGGDFSSAGKTPRTRLAAFARSSGALLPWAPGADAQVQTLALSPNGSKVIVGGSFTTLTSSGGTGSQSARGLGAVDATSGAAVPFAAGTVINNTGTSAAILGLSVDADTVYASGYTFGPGTLEGVVAADPDTGAVRWIEDCHGDTYSVWASGTETYVAGHPHVCSNIGGYPQTQPWTVQHALAFSKAATGTVGTQTGNFIGQPAPSLLTWFPRLAVGSYTGQTQASWSVAGNSQYVVYGGEFPSVNGMQQQGLVRFAVPALAPNKVGPENNAQLQPVVTSPVGGTARVSWQATSDMDNENLTYSVYRDANTSAPLYTVTQASTFWNRPTLGFKDVGLSAGTHTYRVTVRDPLGNAVSTPWTSVTVGAAKPGPLSYSDTVLLDGAQGYWRLGESSGTTAHDLTGASDMLVHTGTSSGVGMGRGGAIANDSNTAFQFFGQVGSTGAGFLSTQTAVPGPTAFSLEAWFKTTSKTGGKIVGFGDKNTGNSSNYDRHIWMDPQGHVNFGVYPGTGRTVTSTKTYNDGKWHQASASLSSAGMVLYVDGVQVASRTDTTTAQLYNGYWRIGGDTPWSGNAYFTGNIDDVALYPMALTADTVAAHFQLGSTGTAVNQAPTASFTAATSGLTATFDGSPSSDVDGTIASYAWDFGDGSTGSGAAPAHTYAAGGSYGVRLTVTDDKGATGSVVQQVTVTAPPPGVQSYASDGFSRTLGTGLGTADVGGAWTTTGGSSATSVTGGVARVQIAKAGGSVTGFLNAVSAGDTDVLMTVALDAMPTGGGTYVDVVARHVGTTDYRAAARVNASRAVTLTVSRVVNGSETVLKSLVVPGLTYSAGVPLVLRLDVAGSGTSTVSAKVWPQGTTEPAVWQVSSSDATPDLQRPGGVGFLVYASGSSTVVPVTASLDDLWAGPAGTEPTGP